MLRPKVVPRQHVRKLALQHHVRTVAPRQHPHVHHHGRANHPRVQRLAPSLLPLLLRLRQLADPRLLVLRAELAQPLRNLLVEPTWRSAARDASARSPRPAGSPRNLPPAGWRRWRQPRLLCWHQAASAFLVVTRHLRVRCAMPAPKFLLVRAGDPAPSAAPSSYTLLAVT